MKLSQVEWKLMNAIWDRHPASARDVMERVEGDANWAYTTIKTMLTRLEKKGAIKSRMRANTALYEPLLTRDKARRSALRAVLDAAFDGAFGPMMQFMVSDEKLSEKQRAELLRALKESKQKGGR
ncbi:MAG: BlaI/MecI/CopY family transcriptional regulator [Candidatus Sumerlaeota bacterium]|nr:BlaI/MecI/CopY family transcriptional regulator [Candidatus Sumerlaeota bacterium]